MEPVIEKKREASKFGSNVLKLITGKVIAQAIAILVMPIISRMYSPSDFGILQVFTSITAFIVIISSLRYEMTIMLPEKDEDAANLVVLSVSIIGFITVLSLLCVYAVNDYVADILGIPQISFYLWFIPLTVFTGGLLQVFQQWSSRRELFGEVAFSGVSSILSSSAVKLTVGTIGKAGPGGLIGANIVGSLIGVLVLTAKNFLFDWAFFKQNVSYSKIIFWVKRYKRFPLFSSWAGLLNGASVESAPILLAYFFSPVIVGFYALGNKVVKTPMNLISGSIARVFYQKVSEEKNRSSSITKIVEEIFIRLVAIGLFPMLVAIIVGKDLFTFVFGAQWAEAGFYMQFFAPWVFFRFISSPISTILFTEEKHFQLLTFQVFMFITVVAVLIIGGIYTTPRTTIILLGLLNSLLYALYCFSIMMVAKVKISKTIKIIFSHIFYSLPFLIIISIVKINELGLFFIFFSALIGGLIYIYIVFKKDELLKDAVLNLLGISRLHI